jgi:hypothetical protein
MLSSDGDTVKTHVHTFIISGEREKRMGWNGRIILIYLESSLEILEVN